MFGFGIQAPISATRRTETVRQVAILSLTI